LRTEKSWPRRRAGCFARFGPMTPEPSATSCVQQAWREHEAELRGDLRRRMAQAADVG